MPPSVVPGLLSGRKCLGHMRGHPMCRGLYPTCVRVPQESKETGYERVSKGEVTALIRSTLVKMG